MKKNKVLKIVLFGPESTGKTTLAKRLAAHYQTNWVPEYAREYLQKKWDYSKDPCSLEDLPIIMKGQSNLENKLLEKSNRLIFCDTNSVVTQIWSETHFDGYCSKEILYNAKNSDHDFYLLTDIDIPWKKDNLRDRPNERKKMFNMFKTKLDQYKFPYKLISGCLQTRIQESIKIIDKIILKT